MSIALLSVCQQRIWSLKKLLNFVLMVQCLQQDWENVLLQADHDHARLLPSGHASGSRNSKSRHFHSSTCKQRTVHLTTTRLLEQLRGTREALLADRSSRKGSGSSDGAVHTSLLAEASKHEHLPRSVRATVSCQRSIAGQCRAVSLPTCRLSPQQPTLNAEPHHSVVAVGR